jgi:hypothetical protein
MTVAIALFLVSLVLFAVKLTVWGVAVLAAFVFWVFPAVLGTVVIVFATLAVIAVALNRFRR